MIIDYKPSFIFQLYEISLKKYVKQRTKIKGEAKNYIETDKRVMLLN
jgi:hypothetical protein